ncbi:BTLCP family transglutaminase-like cysteine proteinase [Oleiphilus messinensis]|uniref:BTLCP family transglutaminase-like cysteine proteinase n=2 Tax=Oleiphilus messinensis TaxID=141451 RepID=A0A1Y0I9R5_9GAMM|nr:BTLCP family transglutaminase-like cysteine proteinase [Oleiphilus messinensis]
MLAVPVMVPLTVYGSPPDPSNDIAHTANNTYLTAWQDLIKQGQSWEDSRKLEETNAFFANFDWKADSTLWKTEDYWATPIETILSKAGDCEDFAVGKYLTLLALGIPMPRLRLTYAVQVELNQAHMVLAYFPADRTDPLILDNLIPEIMPESSRPDLKTKYRFNDKAIWFHESLQSERKVERDISELAGFVKWNEMKQRLNSDPFNQEILQLAQAETERANEQGLHSSEPSTSL